MQAPDAAQELTPAQRAAIRGIFSPPSAGKEDDGGAITYPAHAPDPSEHLTPAQREQLRRIFADSPLASPPSSGDTNSSSLAAGVRGGAATAAPASSMPTGRPCSAEGMKLPRQCCSAACMLACPEYTELPMILTHISRPLWPFVLQYLSNSSIRISVMSIRMQKGARLRQHWPHQRRLRTWPRQARQLQPHGHRRSQQPSKVILPRLPVLGPTRALSLPDHGTLHEACNVSS